MTALCFLAIDRRPHSLQEVASVGAYARLRTPTIPWRDRLDVEFKCGDKMLRTYLYEALNRARHSHRKVVGAQSLGIRLRSEADCAKPRSPWLESLPSFCTGCGSSAPNSNGRQRRLPINPHSRTPTSRRSDQRERTSLPVTLALVRSLLVLRCSKSKPRFTH